MSSTPFAYPQVVSRLFASFRVVKSSISAVHTGFCSGFDSRQLHQNGRSSVASVIVSGFLRFPAVADADACVNGTVKRGDSGGDYFLCQGSSWLHIVPTFDPHSADGYGPSQPLPPLCVRFPC
jgi:hypothetical protein